MAAKKVKIVVVKTFRDKNDHVTIYKPGDELSFEKARVDDLVKRGLAKLKGEGPKKPEETEKKEETVKETPKKAEETKKEENPPKASEPAKKENTPEKK